VAHEAWHPLTMKLDQSALHRLREGVVGLFAPVVDPAMTDWLSGSLRLNDEHVTAVLIAKPEVVGDRRLPLDCSAVVGTTEAGDVLLAEIRSRGYSGGNLPVVNYRSTCLLFDISIEEVNDDLVSEIQAVYFGLIEWLPERIYKEESLEEAGQLVGWRAELRYGSGVRADLGNGFSVRLSTAWAIGGEFDRRTFTTPLAVSVSSVKPVPIGQLILRLDAVHALLNVAHREQVRAAEGSALLVPDSHSCGFWDTNMMSADAGGVAMNYFPHVGLPEIGGVDGLAAWVSIVLRHRRAVEPLVRHVLQPNQTPESRMLSTAAAMEYWVACHRRTDPWAAKVAGEHLPAAITRRVDRSWDSWVGDPERWLNLFWSTYTSLKHEPELEIDAQAVHALEVSARWLLSAALLDQCAGSQAPSRHLFGKTLWETGAHVRDVLSESR
jgi:hypothetical protein